MEGTLVVILDLPQHQDYVYFPELDIVGLSSRLDPSEHADAITRLQDEWRANIHYLHPGAA